MPVGGWWHQPHRRYRAKVGSEGSLPQLSSVAAFLREEIPFGEIAKRVEKAVEKLAGLPANNLDDIWEADRLAREAVNQN